MSTPAPKSSGRIDPNLGALIAGKYRILNKIGEGGMGAVYIAEQQPINRKVAIKVLLGKLAEDEVSVRRFEQEARAISRMQHPNTVTIYDYGKTEDEKLYIVMEFLKGKTLTQVLRQEGVLHPARACKIMRQVCSSLADAHGAGIVHRDLKPDNIFLTEVGGDPDWVKVLDFGVAKLANEGAGTLTQTGMIFGTPKYMSPEQCEGRPIDARADIYALGVVMYELLVGRPPFVADTPVTLLLKHISEPPPPFTKIRPDLSIDPRIEAVVMKSLEKDPDKRHQLVAQLATDLVAFERAISGPVPIYGGGTVPVPVPGAMPTEMIPGTLPNGGSPSGLLPPSHVPGNLSLGLPAETKNLPHPGAAPTGAVTQGQSPPVMPFVPAGTGFTNALTNPIPAPGAGVDTLGGLGSDSSPGLRAPRGPNKLIIGGVAAVLSAGALLAYALQAPRSDAQSSPLPEPPAQTAVPVPANPAPAPAQPPEPAPVPEPDHPAAIAQKHLGHPKAAGEDRHAPGGKTVILSVASDPAGASVSIDGKESGVTPLSTSVPRGEVVTLHFTKPGYQQKDRAVRPERDEAISEHLVKLDAPAAAPAPTPARGEETAAPKSESHPKKAAPATSPEILNDRVDDLK